nr:hypothetical protein BaRGS_004867 [Batillaria attramentaria]
MNELLGWYGYTDKVDHQDTAQLSLNNFRPPSTSPRHHSGDDISDAENAIADEHGDPDCGEERGEEEGEGRSSDSGDSGRASRDGEETGRLSE